MKKKITNDFVLGLLVGEIIWLRNLCNHTEDDVLNNRCTPEEKAEYERLDKIWFDDTMKNRDRENKITKEWLEYRTYAHSLVEKYLPQSIKFDDYCYFQPEDKHSFFKGIQSYLWDTDHCNYDFKEEDIAITFKDEKHYGNIEVKFTLSAMPNY